ncbi:hypothetical protein HRI_002210500 [Hibiscus trionum]|uniref:Uncharacterized protein n=1 Tax=Hibiscus trionum TaxID=183268 RepID=A0A9W7M0Y5_HIBTR|nr:hypothetical protein HRI_002210500 [Hibiscus trionum]
MSTSTSGLYISSTTPGSCLIICSNGKSSPEAKTSMITLKPTSFQSTTTAVNVCVYARRRVVSCQAVSSASVDKDEKYASDCSRPIRDITNSCNVNASEKHTLNHL